MPRHTPALVLGVVLALMGPLASAAVMEQSGQPEQNISLMTTLGVDVPTAQGLRSVAPEGWRTFIQPDASLPPTMSWRIGQEWTSVLSDLAQVGNVPVRLDWVSKAIYVGDVGPVATKKGVSSGTAASVGTPLPKFAIDTGSVEKPAKAAPQPMFNVTTKPVALAAVQPAKTTQPSVASSSASDEVVRKAMDVATVANVAQGSGESIFRKKAKPTEQAVAADIRPAPAEPAAAPVVSATPAPAVAVLPAVAEPKATEPAIAVKPLEPLTPVAISASVDSKPPSGNSDKAAALPPAALVAPATVSVTAPASLPRAPAVDKPWNPVAAAQLADALANTAPAVDAPRVANLLQANPDDFIYTQPVALNKPLARRVAQGIADRFHLHLVWAAPDIQLKGPVTLLGNSADEDVMLLAKAIGYQSSVVLEVPAGQGVLLAVNQTGEYPDLAANRRVTSKPDTLAAKAGAGVAGNGTVGSRAVATIDVANGAASAGGTGGGQVQDGLPQVAVTASAVDADKTPAPGAALSFTVHQGQPLEVALTQFAHEQGYTLAWKVEGGFEAKNTRTYTGESVRQILSNILPMLGVSADIYKQEKHIVVRPVDPAIDY